MGDRCCRVSARQRSKEWANRVGNLGRGKIPRKAGRCACCETRGAKRAVRKAGCGRRGRLAGARRYGGWPAGLFPTDGAARSACWRSPLRRLAGRLISNRWGGEVGLLALAATEAGRPAYFHPMGRRERSVHRSLHGRRGWHLCAGVEGPPGALKTPGGLHHPFGGAVFEEWGEVGTGRKAVPLLRRRRRCSRWEKWFLRATRDARGTRSGAGAR